MNFVKSLAIVALLSTLSACAPSFSAGTKADYYDLAIFPQTPNRASVSITKPASFPDPSITYRLMFDCLSPSIINHVRGEKAVRLDALKNFAKSNNAIEIGDQNFRIQTVSLRCENNRIVYKAANLYELFAFLSDYGGKESLGVGDREIEFVVEEGYIYPNLRIDPYSFATTVFFGNGSVSATSDYGGTVPVTLIQNGVAQPVVFEGKRSRARFDTNQIATLAIKRGVWDVLDFNFNQGSLTWQRVARRPY